MKTATVILLLGLFAGFPARADDEIIIKALVDGPSELIVTTNGFVWANGMNAKPGRHENRNEPTYINNAMWTPAWINSTNARGVDTSETYPWPISSLDLDFELLAVGSTPDVTTIEPVTAPSVTYGEGKMVINIPDPEPGPRWYIFALVRK